MNDKKYRWGALFDLDGVLVDTEGTYTDFWHGIDVEYPTGVENFEYVIKGNTLEAILNRYFPLKEVQEYILARLKAHERQMRYELFPGVEDFLGSLREQGVPCAIVTSSGPAKMQNLFRQLPQLEHLMDVIITDADVTRSKPDPQGYQLAAEKLGLDSADCVVFEDSLAGIEAGRRAGGKVVGIATTNPTGILEPLCHMVACNTGDLTPEQIDRLFT